MLKFPNLSNISAGLIAVIVGFTSSIAIIFQAASATGASSAMISSWILALCLGMGVISISFSLYYRIPILIVWSTPGAALLIVSLQHTSMNEAVGAFLFSALLITIAGLTKSFEKILHHIPRSFASAMLAGILLNFGISIFTTMQYHLFLVGTMFATYLIGKYFFPRFVIMFVFLIGTLIIHFKWHLNLNNFHFLLAHPIFTTPSFSLHALISISIPLFIVTMTSQNIPGITVLRSAGYEPPISSIISWSGVFNLLIAPFGGFALNLAALTAAICAGKEADQEPSKRYLASVCAGFFYILCGLFAATVVELFSSLPKEFILTLAGLALLGTIGSSFKIAFEDNTQLEPSLLVFLITASGCTLFSIDSACWGLITGIFASMLLGKKLSVIKEWAYTLLKSQ